MPWLTSGEEEMGGWLVFPHLPMHLYVYLLLAAGQKNKSRKGTKDKNDRNDEEEHEEVSEVWIITLTLSAAVLLLLLLLILYYLHKRMSQVYRARKRQENVRKRAKEASASLHLDDSSNVQSRGSVDSDASSSGGSEYTNRSRTLVHFSDLDNVWEPHSPGLKFYKMKRSSAPNVGSRLQKRGLGTGKAMFPHYDAVNVGSRRSLNDIRKEYQTRSQNVPDKHERKISISLHPKLAHEPVYYGDIEHGHMMQRRHSWDQPVTQSILKRSDSPRRLRSRKIVSSDISDGRVKSDISMDDNVFSISQSESSGSLTGLNVNSQRGKMTEKTSHRQHYRVGSADTIDIGNADDDDDEEEEEEDDGEADSSVSFSSC